MVAPADIPVTSLPPVPALPGATVALPVPLPVAVVRAELTTKLLRDLTVPITAATLEPTDNAGASATALLPPVAQPAAAGAAPNLPALLTQIETPQGAVQLAVPQILPPALLAALPANIIDRLPNPPALTPGQWQQLFDTNLVQVQLSPMPAALLQRLPADAPPLLAQLLIQPRALAQLFPVITQTEPQPLVNAQILTDIQPPQPGFTTVLLPTRLAEQYRALLNVTASDLTGTQALSATAIQPTEAEDEPPRISLLQQAVTSVRNWLGAPAATIQLQSQTDILSGSVASPPKAAAAVTTPVLATELRTPGLPSPLPQIRLEPFPDTAQPANEQSTLPQSSEWQISARLLGRLPGGDQLLAVHDSSLPFDSTQEHILLAPAALPVAIDKPTLLRLASRQPVASEPLTLEARQPALSAVLALLGTAAPQTAAQVRAQAVVQPGTLAPTLLFLFSALTGQQPASPPAGRSLSPNTTSQVTAQTQSKPTVPPSELSLHADITAVLDRANSTNTATLGTRLLAELRQAVTPQLYSDEHGLPWNGYSLPTQTGESLQTPVTIYFQQPILPQQDHQQQGHARDGETRGTKEKQTRFVVEMRLSRLGQTQLEGLSRRRELDLLLHTAAPLPPMLQKDLQNRYAEIATAAGLAGSLGFSPSSSRAVKFQTAAQAGIATQA